MKNFDRDDISSNPRTKTEVTGLEGFIQARLSRRAMLGGSLAAGLAACAPKTAPYAKALNTQVKSAAPDFTFSEIMRGSDGTHHVPTGYEADVLIRWGDPIHVNGPDFDPLSQSPEMQLQQFGYNNDFIGFVPLSTTRGMLCVNHEYTDAKDMFPKSQRGDISRVVNTEINAHGTSVLEVVKENGRWSVDMASKLNRRITGLTPMKISGPAAGHARMVTPDDPSGKQCLGTLGNCAGGITPWGTYLTAEENIDKYFGGKLASNHAEQANHDRMGVPGEETDWHKIMPRFDVSIAPYEPNRFGWVVEIDPKDPSSQPKKRTAMGRFKHEGAETVMAPDGRIVVYMGDDQRGDYLYKFVTDAPYNPKRPDADILDKGTLYAARFNETTVDWLPLVWGQGPLTAANGFASQADVLISARLAADALGATPMDRPEDVQPAGQQGRVWVMLTNNKNRSAATDAKPLNKLNAANPRPNNIYGHIIEIIEPNGDYTATSSKWDFLVKCGDPNDPKHGAVWNPETTENGWFGSPDNCAVDPSGRLWVATDGNDKTGAADGLWAVETDGARRGTSKAFFRAPIGAEVCGPRFTPDGETLFLSVQHPGTDDDTDYETPMTRWPDFKEAHPPRPSVVAIYKSGGGAVGT